MTTQPNTTRSPDDTSCSGQDAKSRVDLQTTLAILRTEWALDNTQLSWLRTAFTFMTAGLAIDQGTAALREARVLAGTNWVTGSHIVGIALSISSTLFLTFATIGYFRNARRLARVMGAKPTWIPPALLISLLVIVLGCALSILMLNWRK